MGRIDELVSLEFSKWEQRGRGWRVWPETVRPEPPYEEFSGYRLAESHLPTDDGRKPGLLASLFDSLARSISPIPAVTAHEAVEAEPVLSEAPLVAELAASLPANLDVADQAVCAFLNSLSVCIEPTGFEIVGSPDTISIQFASSPADEAPLQRQLTAHFPDLAFTPTRDNLSALWTQIDGDGLIVDFGLAHEFMMPLLTAHSSDPCVGVIAAMSELERDEAAVFQVIFQGVRNPWPASVWRAVTDRNGKALFINKLQLIPGTKTKLTSQLFGAVVRVAAKATSFERSTEIVRSLAYSLRSFTMLESNHLIPLENDEYPYEAHEEDLLNRQSRRTGMLLNREELLGFVHFPSDEVRCPKIVRQQARTRPAIRLPAAGILLGYNRHAGQQSEVRLSTEQRSQHTYVIGASGTGKSTFMFNLIYQDLRNGEGLGVVDPHGDLVDRILGIIPEERIEDVILFDPTDEEYSVGFNILSAHSDLERNLLASDLVSAFQRLSTSWGDQLNAVLNNAILAFLESNRGGTLSDLQRFLIDPEFRNSFLKSVRDPEIVYYWQKAFPQLGGNKSIGPVLTRLNDFLAQKRIRHIVSQRENRLDFANIIDTGKIFLAKLPKGLIGDKNAFLLGSLLVSKFQQTAMSRQRLAAEQRRDYWLYLDEFPNFITSSMAEILSGVRKYRLGLILAHQELHQLQKDSSVASAALSNPLTRICFRVGDEDARKLAQGFSNFEARDLQNLAKGEAIVRIERSDHDFNLAVPLPEAADENDAKAIRERVVTASRKKYAVLRSQIDTRESTTPTHVESTAAPQERVPNPLTPLAIRREQVAPSPSALPALGRGGAQHQLLQARIKAAAEGHGFRVTCEGTIADTKGSADLVLEKERYSIACEISVTTTIDHEFGNIIKCLKGGFNAVAVISIRKAWLKEIAETVAGALGADEAAKISYFTPDQFIEHLTKLQGSIATPPVAPTETVTIRRGFKVKRSAPRLSPEDRRLREEDANKTIAEIIRNKLE
jgi:hypothetical protein